MDWKRCLFTIVVFIVITSLLISECRSILPKNADKTCCDKEMWKPLCPNCDAKMTPSAQKYPISPSLLNVAICFLENIFCDQPFTHKATLKEGKDRKIKVGNNGAISMNIWKIIYLNCRERYEFVIDRRSYTT